jgi:hypothetical protein
MFGNKEISGTKAILLVGVLAGGILVLPARGQSPALAAKPAAAPDPMRYQRNRFPRQAEIYYQSVWGVDSFKVKYTESGEMIRFSWRVLDAAKAAPLHAKEVEPHLFDAQAGVQLVVPKMEKVGQLRQSSTPIEGKSYWMAFSNSGRRVKPGDRVSVQIGQFHADWLVVE